MVICSLTYNESQALKIKSCSVIYKFIGLTLLGPRLPSTTMALARRWPKSLRQARILFSLNKFSPFSSVYYSDSLPLLSVLLQSGIPSSSYKYLNPPASNTAFVNLLDNHFFVIFSFGLNTCFVRCNLFAFQYHLS